MDGARNIFITQSYFSIYFDENVKKGSGSIRLIRNSDNKTVRVYGLNTVEIYGNNLYFGGGDLLEPNEEYYFQFDEGVVEDLYGNKISSIDDNETWNFSTQTTENIPPQITWSIPGNNDGGISLITQISINFNEPILRGQGNMRLHKSSDQSTVEEWNLRRVDSYSQSIDINTTPKLDPSEEYYVTMDSGFVTDIFGNAFGGIYDDSVIKFRTKPLETDKPYIYEVIPSNNRQVERDQTFNFNFNEPIERGLGRITIYSSKDSSVFETFLSDNYEVWYQQVYIRPSKLLEPNSDYYIEFEEGIVVDVMGNSFAGLTGENAYQFTTKADDLIAPEFDILQPYNGQTEVALNTSSLYLYLTEGVIRGSGYINIHRASDDTIFEQIDIATLEQYNFRPTTQGLSIQLKKRLEPDTEYYILADEGILVDLYGNNSVSIQRNAWSFTTVASDQESPEIISLSPNSFDTNVAAGLVDLSIEFDEPVVRGEGKIKVFSYSSDELITEIDINSLNDVFVYEYDNSINFKIQNLVPDERYYINYDEGLLLDLFGNKSAAMSQKDQWNFTTTTINNANFGLRFVFPYDNDRNAEELRSLQLFFDKPVKRGLGKISIMRMEDDSIFEEIDIYNEKVTLDSRGAFMRIDLDRNLAPETEYYINLSEGLVTDVNGKPFEGISDKTSWNFITAGTSEEGSFPEITLLSPKPFESDIRSRAEFLDIEFSEPVTKAAGNITIYSYEDDEIITSININNSRINQYRENTIWVNLDQPISRSGKYYVKIDSGFVEDKFNNSFPGIATKDAWSFTLFDEDDQSEPQAERTYIRDNSTEVSILTRSFSLAFNEYVDYGIGRIYIYELENNTLHETIDVNGPNSIVYIFIKGKRKRPCQYAYFRRIVS
ncbi:MAG: Ig-like domain-containing protein, partial [Bacteroidota bacterium]